MPNSVRTSLKSITRNGSSLVIVLEGRAAAGAHGEDDVEYRGGRSRCCAAWSRATYSSLARPDERRAAADLLFRDDDPDPVPAQHFHRVERGLAAGASSTCTRRRTRPSPRTGPYGSITVPTCSKSDATVRGTRPARLLDEVRDLGVPGQGHAAPVRLGPEPLDRLARDLDLLRADLPAGLAGGAGEEAVADRLGDPVAGVARVEGEPLDCRIAVGPTNFVTATAGQTEMQQRHSMQWQRSLRRPTVLSSGSAPSPPGRRAAIRSRRGTRSTTRSRTTGRLMGSITSPSATGVMQASAGVPFTRTAHEPHWPEPQE